MDILYIFKKKWFWALLVLYFITAIIRINTDGWEFLYSLPGISLVTAFIVTFSSNVRSVKRAYRKLKYFVGYSTFSWDTNSKFLIRKKNLELVNDDQKIKNIINDALKENGIKVALSTIEISKDTLRRTKIYISPLSIYVTIEHTDAESSDEDGFELMWFSMRFRTTIRYKAIRRTINNFLIDLFKDVEKRIEASDVKYVMKVDVEGRSGNFFKEQFIKDLDSKEVDKFSIMLKRPRSTQMISEKGISVTTGRTEELMIAVEDLILRIN